MIVTEKAKDQDGDRARSQLWSAGDLVWAKMTGHPWWPALVSLDPVDGKFYQIKSKTAYYHVFFYGEGAGRRWIPETSILMFSSPSELNEHCALMCSNTTSPLTKKKFSAILKPGSKWKWDVAVIAALDVSNRSPLERLKQFEAYYEFDIATAFSLSNELEMIQKTPNIEIEKPASREPSITTPVGNGEPKRTQKNEEINLQEPASTTPVGNGELKIQRIKEPELVELDCIILAGNDEPKAKEKTRETEIEESMITTAVGSSEPEIIHNIQKSKIQEPARTVGTTVNKANVEIKSTDCDVSIHMSKSDGENMYSGGTVSPFKGPHLEPVGTVSTIKGHRLEPVGTISTIKRHHPLEPVDCSVCIEGFETIELLQNHLGLLHKDKIQNFQTQEFASTGDKVDDKSNMCACKCKEDDCKSLNLEANGGPRHGTARQQWSVGEVVWAKMTGFPWWPAVISSEPTTGLYFSKKDGKNSTFYKYHVNFYGQGGGRQWISDASLIGFCSPSDFFEICKAKAAKTSLKAMKRKFSTAVPPGTRNWWNSAVAAAKKDVEARQHGSLNGAKVLTSGPNEVHQISGPTAMNGALCSQEFQQENESDHTSILTAKGRWSCTKCSKTFAHRRSINQHKLIHVGEKRYKCHVCSKAFMRKTLLTEHSAVHSTKRLFSCEKCPKSFKFKSNYYKHQHIHSDKDYLPQKSTPKVPQSKDHLFPDSSNHLVKGRFRCTKCHKTYMSKHTLILHQRLHTGKNLYKCGICSKAFYQKCHLSEHGVVHMTERLYGCEKCPKRFKSKRHLNFHQRQHTGNFSKKPTQKALHNRKYPSAHMSVPIQHKPQATKHKSARLTCTECSKTFCSKQNLARHQLLHTGQKLYKCGRCAKAFCRKDYLDKHKCFYGKDCIGKQKAPTIDRQFTCLKCSKSFKWKHNLILHQRIHTDKNLHKCGICWKVFYRQDHLTKHSTVHVNKEHLPHSCTECGKRFKLQDSLVLHRLVHKSVQSHRCTVCAKVFKFRSTLLTHMAVHSTDRPYSCQKCDKSYRYKQDLFRHEGVHQDVHPYNCKTCQKLFSCKKYLNSHLHSGCGKRGKTLTITSLPGHMKKALYRCGQCQKNFRSAYHLKRHGIVHGSKRKPNGMTHNQIKQNKHRQVSHLKSRTRERLQKCKLCKSGFRSKVLFAQHLVVHAQG